MLMIMHIVSLIVMIVVIAAATKMMKVLRLIRVVEMRGWWWWLLLLTVIRWILVIRLMSVRGWRRLVNTVNNGCGRRWSKITIIGTIATPFR